MEFKTRSIGDLLIAALSDIHFGKKPNADHLYQELYEIFIKWCLVHKPDIIVLAGDLTDRKLQLNSDAATFCNRFMHDLYELSQNGTTVLIVHGTLSHENFQILSYSHYTGENFRLYTKACADYVKGLKLLILPEEYVVKPEEYYDALLHPTDGPYDFAFGHGMFKHAGGYASDGDETRKHSVTWYVDQFVDNVKAYVDFGHIHTSVEKGNVIYNGSTSRLNHGEEEPKGFYFFEYNKQSGKKKRTFVENTMAPTYNTYFVTYHPKNQNVTIDRPGYSPKFTRKTIFESVAFVEDEMNDQVLTFIKERSKEDDFVRLIPEMDANRGLYQLLLSIARELPNVNVNNKSVERQILKVEVVEESEQEKEDRLKRERYKGLHFLEVTKKYALEEFNEVLDDDTILAAIKPAS